MKRLLLACFLSLATAATGQTCTAVRICHGTSTWFYGPGYINGMYSTNGALPACFNSGYAGDQGDKLVIPSSGNWLVGGNIETSVDGWGPSGLTAVSLRVNGVDSGITIGGDITSPVGTGNNDAYLLQHFESGDVIQLYGADSFFAKYTQLYMVGPLSSTDLADLPSETFSATPVVVAGDTGAYIQPVHAGGSSLFSSYGSIGIVANEAAIYAIHGSIRSAASDCAEGYCATQTVALKGENVSIGATPTGVGLPSMSQQMGGTFLYGTGQGQTTLSFFTIGKFRAADGSPDDAFTLSEVVWASNPSETLTISLPDTLTIYKITDVACGAPAPAAAVKHRSQVY